MYPGASQLGSPRELSAVWSGWLSVWRASRSLEVLVVSVLCVGVLCLFYPEVILEHRTFLPFGSLGEVMGGAPPWQFSGSIRPNPFHIDSGGSAWQLEPWARTVANSYARGELPLWNTHQFFGAPLAGDAQTGAFDLLRLPALITTHAWGWDLYYLSQSALCLLLTYAFARSVGFRPEGAFVAGVAYTFSGFMFIRGNMHYAEIYHLLPAILWGSEQVVRGALRRGVVTVAATVAMTIFAGMPEVTLLTFLYAAAYGAFRSVWEAVARRSWRFAVHRHVLLAVAWLAGIGLAAPLLVPLLEYVGQSFNIHPPDRALGLLYLPMRALAYIGVPYIEGLPTSGLVSGGLIPLDDYSGAAVLMLAILGGLALDRLGNPRSATVFALGSAGVWGAKVFGVPGFQALGQLPLLVQTLISIWATPLVTFSLAILAAAGVHAIATGCVRWRTVLIAGTGFGAYLGVAAALNWSTLQLAGPPHALNTLGLATLAGILALMCAVVARTWPRTLVAVFASVVVVAELVVLAPHDVYSDRYDSLAEPPYVAWLQRQQMGSAQPFRVFSNDGLLYPDYAGAFGLDDPRAIDGLYPSRTWEFVHAFLSPSVTDRFVGGFGHPELPTELVGNKWLNLSNVRFVLRPAGLSPSDAGLASMIVAANYPPTDGLHVAPITIDGQRRESLVQRTSGRVVFHMRPQAAQPRLTFFVGLDPGGGTAVAAEFSAAIQASGQSQILFQRTLDASRPADRHWIPGAIDLTPYVDREVDLILETRSPSAPTSTPAWGDMHLGPVADANQFKQVYAGEVSIWENTHALPRVFLIGDAQPATTTAGAIARMQAPGFDPLQSAVVEIPSAEGLPSGSTPPGSTSITLYRQAEVHIAVEVQRPALLVLTDSYFPGWHASIDGVEAPILPTDVAFRGVLVPPGTHQVTFEYAPASLSIGLALAAGALIGLAAALWRVR